MSSSNTSHERPLKRARNSSESATTTNDAEFYFKDGNLAIGCTNTEDGASIYFRIHQSIICGHSSVFSDMMTVPPPVNIELYDGVPLVRLPDDAVDFKGFLRCIYRVPSSDPFEGPNFAKRMIGTLKVAKKYDVNWIEEKIAARLKSEWPTELDRWLKTHEDHKAHVLRSRNPAAVWHLARLCNLNDIIPLVVYVLLECNSKNSKPRFDLHTLTTDDFHILIIARGKLMAWLRTYANTHRSLYSASTECEHGATDSNSHWCILCSQLLWRDFFAAGVSVGLEVIHKAGFLANITNPHLCDTCTFHIRAQYKQLQKDFFKGLAEGTVFDGLEM